MKQNTHYKVLIQRMNYLDYHKIDKKDSLSTFTYGDHCCTSVSAIMRHSISTGY
jgi:hypothetical protein